MRSRSISGIMLTMLTVSMLTLAFDIQPVKASETIYIRADGSVEPDATPISTVDNITYTFTDNIVGDVLPESSAIVVERSNIIIDGDGYALQGTGEGYGLYFSNRNNVTLKKTYITRFEYGIYLTNYSYGNNITNNGIEDNGVGVYFYSSSNNGLSDNCILNNGFGIVLFYSSNNSLLRSKLEINIWDGIQISDSSDYNNIAGNNIVTNRVGISLYNSSSNSVIENNIANNSQGISFYNSSSNFIGENNITNSLLHGIGLEFSDDNSLIQNNIANTYYWGIEMHHSDSNTIAGNNLADTINGSAILVGDSRINKIYPNNFINNNIGQAFAYGSYRTSWNDGYPSGGNYWSDHVTVDDYSGINQDEPGSDGIVDKPYIIDDYNRDNYPLVEPWSPEPSDPLKALEELIETLETEDLPKGTENSLSSKLKGAIHLLDIGNENGAIHKLMGFMNQVEALRGKKLTDDKADYLILEAQRIIDLIDG